MELKERLERMLDMDITSVEEGEEKVDIKVNGPVGAAIGEKGLKVKACEKAIGKSINIVE